MAKKQLCWTNNAWKTFGGRSPWKPSVIAFDRDARSSVDTTKLLSEKCIEQSGIVCTRTNTRCNNYKLLNHTFYYDQNIFYITYCWYISLSNSVVEANSVNAFKAPLDKFWSHQEVMFDFTVYLSGTGNRSVSAVIVLLVLNILLRTASVVSVWVELFSE